MNVRIYDSFDYKKTKTEVKKVMDNYNFILLLVDNTQKPMMSSDYNLTFNGFSGKSNYSKVGNEGIKKIEYEKYLSRKENSLFMLEFKTISQLKHLIRTKISEL